MLKSRGSRFVVFSLALTALLAAPSVASPAGVIVLHGAPGGSRLIVSAEDEVLIASGSMGDAAPLGCRLSADPTRARCSLAGAAALEINMGPGADFVEIADPLPIPVIVHLGDGSDKFIGNDEPDTCYPEGSPRNRCVGGRGDDICLTGPQDSDCVGGAGNDYCQTGVGSDECWGGPGDDLCVMGPGNDRCHGGPGDDQLFGGPGRDRLFGGAGQDYCDGGPGLGRSPACEAGPRG